MAISSSKLRRAAKRDFPNAKCTISDGTHLSPKKDWVSNDLYFKNFTKWLWDNNLDKWKKHWDCDNFAFAFYTFAQICHARAMDKTVKSDQAQGLTIGVMFYKQEGGGGHAINIIYTEGKLWGFEPQTGKFLELTKDEKASCWFIVF